MPNANTEYEYEYITRDELYKGHTFTHLTTLNQKWIDLPYLLEIDGEKETIQPRYGLAEYTKCIQEVGYDLYLQILEMQKSMTLDNASAPFTEAIGDYLQFISILQNNYIKANVIKEFNDAYSNAGSTYCIVKLAKIIFGEQVEISFFLETHPRKIVFGNIASRENMLLITPEGEHIVTPDLERIVASNISTVAETIPVLTAYFSKFVMSNYYVEFEFNI